MDNIVAMSHVKELSRMEVVIFLIQGCAAPADHTEVNSKRIIMIQRTEEKLQSKRAHRDRGVGEGVLWGRTDDRWDSPGRAGTRTATSRKLTHTVRN